MPTLETSCTKCGETFEVRDMKDRDHIVDSRGELCGGRGRRVWEVHTSEATLMEAMFDRLLPGAGKKPRLKYRPSPLNRLMSQV